MLKPSIMAKVTCDLFCGMSPRHCLTLLGCILVFFCFGIEYTFSNASPYLTSYLRNRSRYSYDVKYSDILWIPTANIVSSSMLMPILCLLEQRLSSRVCILIGGWMMSLGTALAYFTLSYSFSTTILTMGILVGIGKSLVYPLTLKMTFRCVPEKKGITSGIMAACYTGSGFAYNQIITTFINPSNFVPNQIISDDIYFTQASLLDRVPVAYAVLGGGLALMSTLGVVFMTDPDTLNNTHEHTQLAEMSMPKKEPVKTDVTRGERSNLLDRDHSTWNLSPKETLQTERFYITWSMFFCIGYALDVYGVLFKPYGQTFISDDHFLSFVASFASVASGVGNLGSGILADKFTYRPVLLLLVSTFAVFLSTLNVTEHGGKAMFFFWVSAMHFSFSGVYVVLPLMVMDMFGSSHYGVNYGLVHSAGIPFSFLSAFVTSELKDSIGWDGIFLIAAAMAVLSFFLALVLHAKKWPPPTSSLDA